MKNLNVEETRVGALKMALALSAENTLKVGLLNVNNLKPRNNRSSLDFSITITILPDKTGKKRHATKIYKDCTNFLFDVNNENDESYITEFPIENETFLQIVIYDHSRTRTYKIFRGIVLVPIENFESSEIYPIYAYPNVKEETCINSPIWTELGNRSDSIAIKFVNDVNCFMNESFRSGFAQTFEITR